MKSPWLGLLVLLAFTSRAQESQQYNELKAAVEDLRSKLKESESNLTKVRENLDKSLSGFDPTKTQESLKSLKAAIEQLQESQAAAAEKLTADRYDAGKKALDHMVEKAKIIDFVHQLVEVELTINESTNVWADSDFRNVWDRIRDIGTVGGLVLGIVPVFLQDGTDARKWTAFASVTIAGVSNILGGLLGRFGLADTGDAAKASSKIQLLDLSRRAFDDLAVRKKLIEDFHNQNSKFVGGLEEFRKKYALEREAARREQYLAELVVKIDEFEAIVRQIPTLLSAYHGFVSVYQQHEWPAAQREQLEKAKAKVESTRERYDKDIAPILQLNPELRLLLLRRL